MKMQLLFSLPCCLLLACNSSYPVSATEPATTTVISESPSNESSQNQVEDLLATLSSGQLSEEEKSGLILMREEEKLARDTYLALYNLHGLPAFQNIANSEQVHMDAIKSLLDRYQLADPVGSQGYGVFTSPELQELYHTLVSQGTTSLLDAIQVGLLIEELDIYDLKRLEDQLEENEDIAQIYANLRKGSRNHLRSFYAQLLFNNGIYSPTYLTQAEFDEITHTEIERGPVQ